MESGDPFGIPEEEEEDGRRDVVEGGDDLNSLLNDDEQEESAELDVRFETFLLDEDDEEEMDEDNFMVMGHEVKVVVGGVVNPVTNPMPSK